MNNTMNARPADLGSPEVWLTKEEAAKRLKVHPRTIDRYADLGRITRYGFDPAVKQAHVRFKAKEVDGLLKPSPSVAPDMEDSEGGQ